MNVMNSPGEGIFIRKSSFFRSPLSKGDRRNRGTGIQRKSRMSRVAEGKIEEVKWKRWFPETFAVAGRGKGRRNFYLAVRSRGNLQIVEDEEDCHRRDDGGKDDDDEGEKEKESPLPPSTSPMKLARFTSTAPIATYL